MAIVQEIFQEYKLMRDHGAKPNMILKSLRDVVQNLHPVDNQHLSSMIRQWENNKNKKDSETAQVNSLSQETESSSAKTLQKPTPPTAEFIWISCANCNALSREVDVFCRRCGHILGIRSGRYTT